MELADKFHELKLRNEFYKKESLLIGGITIAIILILFFLNSWSNEVFYITAIISVTVLSLKFYDIYNLRADKYCSLLSKLEHEINQQFIKGHAVEKDEQTNLGKKELKNYIVEIKKWSKSIKDYSNNQKDLSKLAESLKISSERLETIISHIELNEKSDSIKPVAENPLDFNTSSAIVLPQSPRLNYYFSKKYEIGAEVRDEKEFRAFLDYLGNSYEQYHSGVGFVNPNDNVRFLYKVFLHFKSKEPAVFNKLIYGPQGGFAFAESEFTE